MTERGKRSLKFIVGFLVLLIIAAIVFKQSFISKLEIISSEPEFKNNNEQPPAQ